MIAKARGAHPGWRWLAGDIAQWTHGEDSFDVIFSNAAMQWVPDHPHVFPRLIAHVAPGRALAVQMPANYDAEAHALMRAVASRFPATNNVREWFTHETAFYYDSLAPLAARVELVVHRLHPRHGRTREHRRMVQRLGDAPVSGCALHTHGTRSFHGGLSGGDSRGLPHTPRRSRALSLPPPLYRGVRSGMRLT